MVRFELFPGVKVIATMALLIVVAAVAACGSDDSSVVAGGGGDPENPKIIRIVESTSVFTEDNVRAIGWKPQRDLLIDYPGTTVAKWGISCIPRKSGC